MNITIKPDESAIVIGRKGTGKTHLLKTIMKASSPQGHHRNIILDTKQAGDFVEYPTCTRLKDVPKLVEKHPTICYAPIKEEARSEDYINGFFEWCYDRWNTRIVIDELGSIIYANDTPEAYRDITDRGRAKRVTFLQGTQKPVFVPHAALSESDHFFLLDLNIEDARRKMAGMMGNAVMKRPTDRHGFWYYHHQLNDPIYVPSI